METVNADLLLSYIFIDPNFIDSFGVIPFTTEEIYVKRSPLYTQNSTNSLNIEY